MTGPLAGIKVLDLTRLQPGNYATMLMADLGAEVIKVEEPGRGDYVRWTPPMVGDQSAMHLVLNRNKKSVTLNLKHEEGPGILRELVKSADVLIESFRPGVMARLGVGYDDLSSHNEGLIYAAITGYGQDGPLSQSAGHDINYVAAVGILDTTGSSDGPPVLPSVQIADLSGSMMAVIGTLAALVRRGAGGKGEFVDIGMADVALSWLSLHLAPWFAGAKPLQRGAGYLNGGYHFYRVYECSDGRFLSVGALEPQFYANLCAVTGHQELVPEQFVAADRLAELHKIFESTFRSRTQAEWLEMFAGVDACVAPVNDFEQMWQDPQLRARDMLIDDAPGDLPKTLGVPIKLKANPGELGAEAPRLGEHNQQVYSAIGLGDRIGHLTQIGAI